MVDFHSSMSVSGTAGVGKHIIREHLNSKDALGEARQLHFPDYFGGVNNSDDTSAVICCTTQKREENTEKTHQLKYVTYSYRNVIFSYPSIQRLFMIFCR